MISPPRCCFSSNMYTISNSWNSLMLNSVRFPLRLNLPSDHNVYSASFIEYYGLEHDYKMKEFDILPELLLRSLSWLYMCTNMVDFFPHVWNDVNENEELSDGAIMKATMAWQDILTALRERSLTCDTLSRYYHFLSSHVELVTLLRTGNSSGKTPDWIVLPENDVGVQTDLQNISDDLLLWRKIEQFTQAESKAFLKELLESAKKFLDSCAEDTLLSWKSNYDLLCSSVEKESMTWSQLSMTDVLSCSYLASTLDNSIFNISLSLLSALSNNEKLNIFLRSVVNDNAFSSALEIALGLTEMECPSEIWDTTSNRVDEKYISMLRNIRSYLHVYFYEYPVKLQSFDSFVFIFGSLNVSMKPDVIAQNIIDCGEVRQALMEVINFTSEGASTNRLMKIYERETASFWSCQSSTSVYQQNFTDEHVLMLEYCEINRSDNSPNAKAYALSELLDFQSNVVLSKSSDLLSENYLQFVIDRFLHQFCWMRRFRESLRNLHRLGHFDYFPVYNKKFSVDLDDVDFIDSVISAEKEARHWNNRVNNLRERFYFLNYFEMKNIRKFLGLMLSLSDNNDKCTIVSNTVSDMVCFLNIDYCSDEEFLQSLSMEVIDAWEKIVVSKSETCVASDYLEDICGLLNSIFGNIPGRIRQAVFKEDVAQYFALPQLRPGVVYTTKAPTTHAEYNQALTLFGSCGIFPEWDTCLLCSEYTTEEQVCNFFRRWQKSHLYRQNNKLFYLLEVQNLSYEIQDAVIAFLRLVSSTANNSQFTGKKCAVILSCLSGKYQCPLTSHVNHNSLSIQPFPHSVITQMFLNSNSPVEVHNSVAPGAGKSFNIRTKATKFELDYLHIPINHSSLKEKECHQILHRLCSSTSHFTKSGHLIHMDVSSCINSSLSPLLFEICVLGLSHDYGCDNIFWHSPPTVICLELACGLMEKKLQHCKIYPSIAATASRRTFLFDEGALESGMGPDFTSSLHDGTVSDDMKMGETLKSNAFERLRYVCIALKVLKVSGGTFPYKFDVVAEKSLPPRSCDSDLENNWKESDLLKINLGPTLVIKEKRAQEAPMDDSKEKAALAGADLDGKLAFDLLFAAIGKVYHNNDLYEFRHGDHLSLWCLWSFVNVLYWQLQEMHNVESPLNGACMPDSQSELRTIADDVRAKRKIKGEIIQFMIKTAREFAIRQNVVTKVTEKKIVAAKIEGMSRGEFNTFWARTPFDNEGQPCFMSRNGEYYLYYRSLANCWVIDDIIESTGATYCYSQTGDINSAWTVAPTWEYDRRILAKCNTVSGATDAYRNEAVTISGCGLVAPDSSCSCDDDGVYLRQPPYDDINKYPHYIKDRDHPKKRRHLFLSNHRDYVVAPQCNEDQGFFFAV